MPAPWVLLRWIWMSPCGVMQVLVFFGLSVFLVVLVTLWYRRRGLGMGML